MNKKLLLMGGLFLSGQLLAQQTPVSQTAQNKNALLEELTGINCTWCPDGHKRATQIAAANPGRVVLANIHAGGFANTNPDLRTAAGNALDVFFNADGYPAGAVQRTPYGSETMLATGRGNWTTQVASTLSQASPVNVAMNATIDATTRELTLNVEIFYTTPQASGTNHYLNIGMLQNNFEGPQVGSALNPDAVLPNGNYLHQHIFRGFINAGGTWGEQIDASQTGVITKTVVYTLPANINNIPLSIGDLEFYAFVHEGHNSLNNSKVLNVASIEPEYTNVPVATANAVNIVNNIAICEGSSFSPIVKVSNGGAAITSLEFSTSINGGTAVPYTWNGNIPSFGSAEITLSALTMGTPQGNNTVAVSITSVNGGAGQIGTATTTKPLTVATNTANSPMGVVKVTTDRYGSETSWKLFNSAGNVVVQGGPYADAASNGAYPQPDVNFGIIPNECYKLIVYDSYGDGFDSGYGNGNIEVQSNGVLVAAVSSFSSGSEKQDVFKSAGTLDVETIDVANFTVFPNPASDKVTIAFEAKGGDYAIEVTDLQGRVVSTESFSNLTGSQSIELNTSNLKAGNYLVSIAKEGASFTKMISIK